MNQPLVSRFLMVAVAVMALGVGSAANATLIDYFTLDIGPDGHRVEPGFGTFSDADAGGNNQNGPEVSGALFVSATGDALTISLDDTNQSGADDGQIDWRDRGNGSSDPLVRVAEDFVKNNSGTVRVTISGLSAGKYQTTSFHVDPSFTQSEAIGVFVQSENGGGFVDTGVLGNANINNGGPGGLTTADIIASQAVFGFTANGTDDVIFVFDGNSANDTEVPLNGFVIQKVVPEPTTAVLGLMGLAGITLRRRRNA